MEWHYQIAGRDMRPVSEAHLLDLLQSGEISLDTPVRANADAPWTPYALLRPTEPPPLPAPTTEPEAPIREWRCSVCGGDFKHRDVLLLSDATLCRQCKPLYFQRVRQGSLEDSAKRPASFGQRAAAKLIDLNMAGSFLFLGMGIQYLTQSENMVFSMVSTAGPVLFYGIASIWATGRFGGSPGKLALGLRIECAHGDPPGYLLATGRLSAELLSTMCLTLGYFMQPLDPDHKCLHDHICQTRVIAGRD